MHRALLVGGAVCILVLGGGLTPVITSAATATPAVSSLTMTPGPLEVDGLTGVGLAHIEVTASDPNGPIGVCDAMDAEIYWMNQITVTLVRTSGGPATRVTLQLRQHATGVDGEHWSGDWRVAATRGGTWTITNLWWCSGSTFSAVDPPSLGMVRTVAVVGSHVPTVSLVRTPRVAAYDGRQWMVATYRGTTGRPLVGYRIVYGDDTTCGFDGNGVSNLVTDSRGRVTVRLTSLWQCLYFAYPGGLPWTPLSTVQASGDIYRYTWYRTVGAGLSVAAAQLGSSVTVTGHVYPVRMPVSLQRLVGRTWRTLATSSTRASGRVTFAFVAADRGTAVLRLLARGVPTGYGPPSLAPTPSRTLRLTVG